MVDNYTDKLINNQFISYEKNFYSFGFSCSAFCRYC